MGSDNSMALHYLQTSSAGVHTPQGIKREEEAPTFFIPTLLTILSLVYCRP
jgi:hypothetical protein